MIQFAQIRYAGQRRVAYGGEFCGTYTRNRGPNCDRRRSVTMSIFWLRTAAALYSFGLLYALIYLFRKSTQLFTPALIVFAIGTVFHLVSIVELRAETGHLPLNNFYETSSLCAFLIAVLFLIAYTYYHISIFAVCLFPLVFFMTLIGATEFPVPSWSSPEVRNAWLIAHITPLFTAYAPLILPPVAPAYY